MTIRNKFIYKFCTNESPDLWALAEYEDVDPGHMVKLTRKLGRKKVLITVREVEKDRIKGRHISPPASALQDVETIERSKIEETKFLMISGEVVTKAYDLRRLKV